MLPEFSLPTVTYGIRVSFFLVGLLFQSCRSDKEGVHAVNITEEGLDLRFAAPQLSAALATLGSVCLCKRSTADAPNVAIAIAPSLLSLS
jgi:hypothetical protein